MYQQSNATILFVDNNGNGDDGKLIQLFLKKERHDRVILCDLEKQQLKEVTEKENLDLIIINFMIPGIYPHQVYQDLRVLPNLEDTPILFYRVGSQEAAHIVKKLGAIGFTDFYSQPEQLLEARDIALSGGTYYPNI